MIEDDIELLDLVSDLFDEPGISCTKAASFDDALAIIEKDCNFDFYMIDIRLGNKSGLELIRPINEKSRNSNYKIIIASGNISDDVRENYDAWKYCNKPYDIYNLIDEIKSHANLRLKESA